MLLDSFLLNVCIQKREPMRTSEVMAVGNANDADVTTAAHVRTREVCMSHLLHPLKNSYVFTSQDEHNASLIFISCRYGFQHEGSPSYQRYCKFTYNFCICKRFKEDFLLLTLFLHQILIRVWSDKLLFLYHRI